MIDIFLTDCGPGLGSKVAPFYTLIRSAGRALVAVAGPLLEAEPVQGLFRPDCYGKQGGVLSSLVSTMSKWTDMGEDRKTVNIEKRQ